MKRCGGVGGREGDLFKKCGLCGRVGEKSRRPVQLFKKSFPLPRRIVEVDFCTIQQIEYDPIQIVQWRLGRKAPGRKGLFPLRGATKNN